MIKNSKLFKKSKSVKQRYATRKLKVGMVSVLLGFTFFIGTSDLLNKTNVTFAVSATQTSQVESEVAKFKEDNKDILAKDETKVTKEDKGAVEKALKDYEGLSSDAKEKLESEKSKLDTMNLFEIAISYLVNPEDKINAEVAKFKEDNKEILGKDVAAVKKEDKAAAEKALKAYEGLSDGAKAKLEEEKEKLNLIKDLSEVVSDIVNPEDKINAAAEKFKEDNKAILAKDETSVTKADKDAVEKALNDYSALSKDVQSKLLNEKTKLETQKDFIDSSADIITPEDYTAKVNAEVAKFKEDNKVILAKDETAVTKEDKGAVEKALNDYKGLSYSAKERLKAENEKLNTMKDFIDSLADIITPEDYEVKVNAEVAKFKEDHSTILAKDETTVTKAADEEAVVNALNAYNGLSYSAKERLKAENEKLNLMKDFIDSSADIITPEDYAKKVNAEIGKYKEDNKDILVKDELGVTITDEGAVEKALKEYEGLSYSAKERLKAENEKLNIMKDFIEALKDIETPEKREARIQSEANKFKEDNKDILSKGEFDVTKKDAPAIEKAIAEYNKLSDSVRERLSKEKEKLDLMNDFTVIAEDIVNGKPGSSGHSSSSGGSSGGGSSVSSSSSETKNTKKLENQNRVAGKNRYETAVNVSKMLYKNGADVVILANSEKYSDVLSAIPYGNMIKAPVLYADLNRLPGETLNEIKRLGAKKVIFIGGYGTLNNEIYNSLKKSGYAIDRIGGKDRYETSKLISEKMKASGAKGINDAILVNGENYPDALSASQLASKNQIPILLTKSSNLSKYTLEKLKDNKNGKIYIIGGQNSVSASIENSLKADKKNSVERFAGKDRYETSVKISKSLNSNPKAAVFASGETFQDALIAGEVSGHEDIPLVLVGKSKISNSVNDYLINNKFDKAYLIGGESTVKDIEINTSKTK